EGRLRKDIRYGRTPDSGVFGFIHDQKAARNLEVEMWTLYKTRNPVFVASYDGVPVLTIYPNPPKLRAARRFKRSPSTSHGKPTHSTPTSPQQRDAQPRVEPPALNQPPEPGKPPPAFKPKQLRPHGIEVPLQRDGMGSDAHR
ncbi:MAG: hypothetical protein AAFS10_27790, partial [Myxococcota bacterium]